MNNSGPISLNSGTYGESVTIELGLGSGTQFNLLDSRIRTLVGKPTGAITMPGDFYSKSAVAQYPFSAYSFTTSGVGAAGGGPKSSPGVVKATMGASSGSSAAVSYALTLRSYWANSNAGTQTYQSPRDAVFLSPTTNWNITDLTNMGITYTDVTTTSVTRTVNLTYNLDDTFTGGYYIVTKTGAATFSLWSSGTYTQQVSRLASAGGRQYNLTNSWTIPAPTSDQLIVIAWTDNTGTDNLRWSLT